MFVLPSAQNFNFSATGKLANGLNKIESEKISLYTANQPRLTVNNLGNVGIGTTNPQEQLHITSNLRVDGSTTLSTLSIDNLTVTNSLLVQGTTTSINTETLTVEDNIIRLADNNPADITDIGFYGKYIDTGTTYYRGLIHDADDNAWKLFDNETTEPTTTMTFGNTPLLQISDTGDIQVKGSILPDVDTSYDLGTTGQRFRDLYLSGSSINLGGLLLTNNSGTLDTGESKLTTFGEFKVNPERQFLFATNYASISNLEVITDLTEFASSATIALKDESDNTLLSLSSNGSTASITSDTGSAMRFFSSVVRFDQPIDMDSGVNIAMNNNNIVGAGTIDADSIGIGTASPRGNFDIYGTNPQAIIRTASEYEEATLFLGTPLNGSSAMKAAIIAQGIQGVGWGRPKLHFCIDNTTSHDVAFNASVSNARMTIQPDGYIGLGVTNPKGFFHLNSSGTSNITTDISSNAAMLITTDTQKRIYFENLDAATNEKVSVLDFFEGGLSFNVLNDTASAGVHNNILRLDYTDGYVGIGTDNPGEPLTVYDTASAANNNIVSFLSPNLTDGEYNWIHLGKAMSVNDSGAIGYRYSSGTDAKIQLGFHSNASLFTIEEGGNVGIGTTNPGEELDVNGNILIQDRDDTWQSTLSILPDSGTGWQVNVGGSLNSAIGNGNLGFYSTAYRMVLLSSGNVGIGTTNPSQNLHVYNGSGSANILIQSTASNHYSEFNLTGNGGDALFTYFPTAGAFGSGITNNNDALVIRSGNLSGGFHIGNTNDVPITFYANNTQRVQITNTSPYAYKTSGGSWGTLSDRRLKTNERDITDPLGKITSLQPKHFEYIDIGVTGYPEGTRTGFIAQDVEEVFPGHITEIDPITDVDKNKFAGQKIKAIDADFIPYIIGAIKQMKSEYDQQILDMGITISNLQAQIDLQHP